MVLAHLCERWLKWGDVVIDHTYETQNHILQILYILFTPLIFDPQEVYSRIENLSSNI
jgi:hypothetical protein